MKIGHYMFSSSVWVVHCHNGDKHHFLQFLWIFVSWVQWKYGWFFFFSTGLSLFDSLRVCVFFLPSVCLSDTFLVSFSIWMDLKHTNRQRIFHALCALSKWQKKKKHCHARKTKRKIFLIVINCECQRFTTNTNYEPFAHDFWEAYKLKLFCSSLPFYDTCTKHLCSRFAVYFPFHQTYLPSVLLSLF